ncbi:MAG: hypothetical protein ABEH56_00260 [Salinirussus sp.]
MRGRLAVLLAVVAAGAVVVPAGAAPVNSTGAVLVVTPSVSPTQPTTGTNFTVTATVANVDAESPDYVLSDVEVRNTSSADSDLLGESNARSYVESGEEVRQSVPVDADEAGNRTLYLHARLSGPDEAFTIVRPLRVDVRNPHPRLSASAGPVRSDGSTTLNVTVANSRNASVRSLALDLGADGADIQDDRRVVASLAPGNTETVSMTADDVSAGELDLTATVSYVTSGGDRRRVTRHLSAAVGSTAGVQPELSASAAPVGPSGETTVDVTVVNARDAAMRALSVELGGNLSLTETRKVRSELPSGAAANFSFETDTVTPGDRTVTVTLDYTTADGVRGTLERDLRVSLEPVRNAGNVSLTGIRISPGTSGLEIRGSASNVGSTNVTGVTVGVARGDEVAPAQSGASYFVGNVEAGEFASFDVSAVPRTNGSVTIPLTVSYVVDGVRTERIVEVEYRPPDRPATPRGNGGGLPLVLIGGAAVAVGGVAVTWWRVRE